MKAPASSSTIEVNDSEHKFIQGIESSISNSNIIQVQTDIKGAAKYVESNQVHAKAVDRLSSKSNSNKVYVQTDIKGKQV